jgi:hypothetical protein
VTQPKTLAFVSFENAGLQRTTSASTCVTSFSSSPFSRKNTRCSAASCERICGDVRKVRARSSSAVLSSPAIVDGGLTDSAPSEGAGEGSLLSSSGIGGSKDHWVLVGQTYGTDIPSFTHILLLIQDSLLVLPKYPQKSDSSREYLSSTHTLFESQNEGFLVLVCSKLMTISDLYPVTLLALTACIGCRALTPKECSSTSGPLA